MTLYVSKGDYITYIKLNTDDLAVYLNTTYYPIEPVAYRFQPSKHYYYIIIIY